MDQTGCPKKIKWLNSIFCWRGRRQRKLDLDSEPHSSTPLKAELHGYRNQSFHKPEKHQSKYQCQSGHSGQQKLAKVKSRIVSSFTSNKRTSSSSATGNTAETKSTQADSTEVPSFPKRPFFYHSSSPNQAIGRSLKRHPSRSAIKPRQTSGQGDLPLPKNNTYVAIKDDSESITALSMSESGFFELRR